MRRVMIVFSSITLLVSLMEPSLAQRPGVPGRRVGGGSRWTQPNLEPSANHQAMFSKISFGT
jgi:hypothetical protein